MSELKISNMLDKGLIRIKKRKSPKKKSISSEKYKQYLDTKRKIKTKTPVQSILKKNVKKETPSKKSITINTDKNIVKSPDNLKKITVVNNPLQPIFKINRKIETKKEVKKTKLKKKKKNKRSKRKPRKVSFTVRKQSKKKIVPQKSKNTDEMLKELKNKGISISGKSNRLIKDIYMCIANDNIEIKKE